MCDGRSGDAVCACDVACVGDVNAARNDDGEGVAVDVTGSVMDMCNADADAGCVGIGACNTCDVCVVVSVSAYRNALIS